MSEWKEVTIQEITSKLGDGLHGTPTYSDDGEYYFVNGNNLKEGKIVIDDKTKKVSIKEFEKYKKELTDRTLLVSINGTLGNVAYYNNEKIILGKSACYFNVNKDVSLDYVRYILDSRYFKYYIDKFSSGTTIQNLSLKAMREFPFMLPEKDEQDEIANTLSKLDKKITLLRQQNQDLEELAQTLFKRWFVEFEFPNENGEPYKSSGGLMVESELGEIPEGWKLKPLDKIVKVHNGYSYKGVELQESNTALVTLKNFDRNGGFRLDGFKELVSDKFKEKHVVAVGDLIVAHTDLTQDAEVLGNPAIIMKNGKYNELVMSMDLVKVESLEEDITVEFLYYLMRDKRFKYHCKGYANGTTVLHLSKSAIPEYLFPFPVDSQLIIDFGNYAKSVYKKITTNIEEIQTLTQLRDTLLPKLMSGEIRIT